MGLKFRHVVFLPCIILVSVFGFRFTEVGASNTQTGRILVEAQNDTQSALTIRTERVDPLDDLKKYKGGYNITNKHYWSSTIFTGKFGYIIAALWIVAGLIYAVILLAAALCCNKKREIERRRFPCTRKYCLWPLVFGVLFTLLSIVASGIALRGSTTFHSRAKATKDIIVGAANNASGTIYNVTEAVRALQTDPQLSAGLDEASSSRLNSTLSRLDGEADNIRRKALKSMRLLNKGLNIMNVVTIVTVSINLVAVLALIALGPLQRLSRIFHMLIILCWVLTCLFWLYFGLYYFLNKFAGDTCAALEEFRQDPRNSTLHSILPCNDHPSARTSLREVGAGIHDIIDQVNANISTLQALSLPGVEYVCNPFSGPPDYSYQPQNCSSNTIQIGNIPQALKMYSCSNETCQLGQFIPAGIYSGAVVYTRSVQNILDAYPAMQSLVSCQLVKDAFSRILSEECRPLKKYAHMTWAAYAALATVMVALLVVLAAVARREGAFCSAGGYIKPHSSSTENSEVDASEVMANRHLELAEA